MGEWQPISTAPKGEMEMILIAFDGDVAPGFFDDGTDDEGNQYDEPGWFWCDVDGNGPCEPTHWMPLPEPPGRAALQQEGER